MVQTTSSSELLIRSTEIGNATSDPSERSEANFDSVTPKCLDDEVITGNSLSSAHEAVEQRKTVRVNNVKKKPVGLRFIETTFYRALASLDYAFSINLVTLIIQTRRE